MVALALVTPASPPPNAAPSVVVVVIPDAEFKACLNAELHRPESLDLTDVHLARITTLSCTGRPVRDLQGWSWLTNLEDFYGPAMLLDGRLGVPGTLTRLRHLDLSHNRLTSIRISPQVTRLEYLGVGNNLLTELPLPKELVGLKFVHASNNRIRSLGELRRMSPALRVYAHNQSVQLPPARVGVSYVHGVRDHRNGVVLVDLGSGYTFVVALRYSRPGVYALRFRQSDATSPFGSFTGTIHQVVPEPTVGGRQLFRDLRQPHRAAALRVGRWRNHRADVAVRRLVEVDDDRRMVAGQLPLAGGPVDPGGGHPRGDRG